ncbi:MAG TPA: hypothetical protein VLZ75_00605 [Chitinophagales bacterium]|nr:hypothetical protein [Chitinophagales bacterium]
MEQKPKITEKNGRDKNGKFLTGNNGKPKGAVNKTTKDIKEFITAFLNDKAFEIPQIWDSLEDKDKATLYLHLLKIVMPKPLDESTEYLLNINQSLEKDVLLNEILKKLQ